MSSGTNTARSTGSEERTCHWVWIEVPSTSFEYADDAIWGWGLSCGCFEDDPLDDYDDPDVRPDLGWRFCPYCGARVIGDDES